MLGSLSSEVNADLDDSLRAAAVFAYANIIVNLADYRGVGGNVLHVIFSLCRGLAER